MTNKDSFFDADGESLQTPSKKFWVVEIGETF